MTPSQTVSATDQIYESDHEISNAFPVIYQLNVVLQESQPLIWRRIQVPRFGEKVYAEPDPEGYHFGPRGG
jgi:hypothetical protein